MRAQDIIRARKKILDWGSWQQEKMPATAFPLKKGKRRSYMLRPPWRWRVVKFDSLDRQFRVLIAYRPDLEEYTAILGMDDAGDTKIVANLAFHGTHPGWHMHTFCGNVDDIVSGVQRFPGQRRMPLARRRHRSTLYVRGGGPMNDALALQIVVERFKLSADLGPLFSGRS